MIEPVLTNMGFELVRVLILGKLTPTLQIMVDRINGSLINVDDCEQISHVVSTVLDVQDPIEGSWTLEVSSPGIDRPLIKEKDWNRFSGHLAKAEMLIPIEGKKRFTGVALGADKENARMRLEDGSEVLLPLGEIRKAKLILTEGLIKAYQLMIPPEDEGNDFLEIEEKDSCQSRRIDKIKRHKTH